MVTITNSKPTKKRNAAKHYHCKMKKRRGLKRYYKRLRQCNEWDYWCDALSNESGWFNYAHQHFDWKSYGDICWRERKEHLDVLFKHFSVIANRVKNLKRPFQMFALIDLNDSGQDALYFHTPNPYTGYPFIIPQGGIKGCQLKNLPLKKYLEELIEEGYTVFTFERDSCFVFKENVGDSLCENNDNKQQTD